MSLKPGVGVHAEVTNPPAKATGVIQNPMTPVEYGRTAEKSKYTVTVTVKLPDTGDPVTPDSVQVQVTVYVAASSKVIAVEAAAGVAIVPAPPAMAHRNVPADVLTPVPATLEL